MKNTKPQARDKGRRETKHTKKCSPSSVQLDLLWGEIDLSNPLSMSSYKEIQMGYKKLTSTSSQRTTLTSTYFSNLTNEQDIQ